MSPPPDDGDLAARIRVGDRAAFDELVATHWRRVLAWFWRRLPVTEAEDMAQTVFVNAWRAVRGGGQQLADSTAWSRYLLTCARNLLRDHWRHQSRTPPADHLLDETAAEVAGTSSAHASLADDERTALEDCLDRLDARSRDLCWQHFVDGRSKRDLARSSGRPESSIRVDVTRILQQLRRCLEAKGAAP